MAENMSDVPVGAEDAQGDVLPVPPVDDKQDWAERRRVADRAWELGRKLVVPKAKRPVPPSRLTVRQRHRSR